MNKDFILAIEELESERGINKEELFEMIEMALVAAYKKDYGATRNVNAYINRENGEISIYTSLKVVQEVEDEFMEMSLAEAQEIDSDYEIGDEVEFVVTPEDFSRIAAQNVKNTLIQKLKEKEREMIYDEYIDRVGTIMSGVVQSENRGTLYISLGKTEGILPVKEQIPGERFSPGQRIKVYVMDIRKSNKGPQIFLSRSHPGLVQGLFEMEVPEIEDGLVEIKAITREAGSRTKMAVFSKDESIDPVGSCVGSRGIRVQNVVDELYNEKIDIIVWDEDLETFIINVLSPSKVSSVEIDKIEQVAKVIVPDNQLSLAIGRSGQNVRLAARICGFKIDIKSESAAKMEEQIIEDKVSLNEEDIENVEKVIDEISEEKNDVFDVSKEDILDENDLDTGESLE